MVNASIIETFKAEISFRLSENLRFLDVAMEQISETEIWASEKANLNSIGNLLLHITGNLRQYGVTAIKGSFDNRNRDAEFSEKGSHNKTELLEKLEDVLSELSIVMNELKDDEWTIMKRVQGFDISVLGCFLHTTEHMSYHTGQIVEKVKSLKKIDLDLYADFDLNKKAE